VKKLEKRRRTNNMEEEFVETTPEMDKELSFGKEEGEE
jgi:hypothetical protein